MITAKQTLTRTIVQITLLSAGLLILVGISAASIYLVNRAREDAALVTHTVEVEKQVSLALLQVRRAESSERGFVLTGNTDLLKDFEEAEAGVQPAFEALRNLTLDNPKQIVLIDQILPLVNARVAEFRRAVDLAGRGQTDDAVRIVREGATRANTVSIRRLAEEVLEEESQLMARRVASADRSQSLSAIVTATGSALVVLLAAISIMLVRGSARARDAAEQQLRDNNANLETTVEERTADLREANEEIQRFAYIVSHDLRSPLVNIMGFTSELEELRGDIFKRIGELSHPEATPQPQDDAEPQLEAQDQMLSEEYSEALRFIKSSIGKMDRLINAILNLTREGRREYQPEQIDTRALIEGIAATVAHQASEANAEIRVEPLPDLVSDRLALEQIFSNLIDNALKYLKPGVPGVIQIRGRRKLGYIIYDIKDNGRGIDPRDHQRIFDLFRRAGAQDRPGEGIGLAHVRALVRRLGGTLSVSSELNQGSTFTVMLPTRWNASLEERKS